MDHQWSKSRGPKAPRSSIVAVRSDVSLTTTTSLETEKPTHQLGFFGSIPLKSAISQLRILGIIFLCGPGMFAGITGLGGAGLSDPIPFNNSLIANYAASAVFGFIAAPICTRLAFKLSLMIGGAAFAFFSVSLLIYKQVQTGWILTLGGIINGVLGSLEWTARGSMMMTYPLLKEKGKHVSFSLTMFNLGAILCGLVGGFSFIILDRTNVTADCLSPKLTLGLDNIQHRDIYRFRCDHVNCRTIGTPDSVSEGCDSQ